MNYLDLLNHSYEKTKEFLDPTMGKLEYLSMEIFDFTTYDGEMDKLFAQKAVEVCKAISDKKTFDYQKTEDGYLWYLIIVNMPFFKNKLEWGTSIRGAWWALHGNDQFELSSCGLFDGEEQILDDPLKFNNTEWDEFVNALNEFVN